MIDKKEKSTIFIKDCGGYPKIVFFDENESVMDKDQMKKVEKKTFS